MHLIHIWRFSLHSLASCANVYTKIKVACRIPNSLCKGVISGYDDKAKDRRQAYCLEFFMFPKTLTGKILFKIRPIRVDFIRPFQLSHLTCLALHP